MIARTMLKSAAGSNKHVKPRSRPRYVGRGAVEVGSDVHGADGMLRNSEYLLSVSFSIDTTATQCQCYFDV